LESYVKKKGGLFMNRYKDDQTLGYNCNCPPLFLVFLLLLALLLHNASAQESPMPQAVTTGAGQKSEQTAATPPSLSSLLTQAVVFIYEDKTPANSQNLVPGRVLGTAFIIGIPLPGRPEKSIPFIVTAKHVVSGESKILVRFTLKSGNEPGFAQYDLEGLRKNNDLWEYPNDEGVDLMVFRTPVYDSIKFLMFPIDLIASMETFTKEDINVSDRVMIPCLMPNFPGITQNYPIFRDGTIALVTEEPISFTWKLGTRVIKTSQRVIFINSVVNEGFSGAPVFLWPGMRSTPKGTMFGGNPWLVGIVHGFFPLPRNVVDAEGNDVTIVKREPGLLGQINPPKELKVYSKENPGTGMIFPSWRLLEILHYDTVKKRVQVLTDEEIAKEPKN
jgi:hypothetical protein